MARFALCIQHGSTDIMSPSQYWRVKPAHLPNGYSSETNARTIGFQQSPVHLFTDQRGYSDERTDILFTEKPDADWNLMGLEADPRQCQHRSHEDGFWYEQCPDCGVNNPY